MNLQITGLKLDRPPYSNIQQLSQQPDAEEGKEPEKRKRKKVLHSASNPSTGTVSGNGNGAGE